ncbi:DUF3169 family protein [Lentibacillus sediminis]|uniref:DUF3169 family protein n=1 Tax=Lentibacillus sediminis TaxID=1940529 RepID=UPI000C1BE492|nr:DUF3169 family protein [Lentibacillus sediminis]
MKKIKVVYWLSLVVMLLAVWAFVPLYSFANQFADGVKNGGSIYIEVSLTPLLIFFVIGGGISILLYRFNRKKNKGLLSSLFAPGEFSEEDEREKMITARACRRVYMSMIPVFGVMLILMMAYPFLIDIIPYYPILVVFILPLAQLTVYYLSVRKQTS